MTTSDIPPTNQANHSGIRGALASIPVAALAVAFIVWLTVRDSLPARIASHFSGSSPDDSMTVAGFGMVALILGGIGAVMLWTLAASRRPLAGMTGAMFGFLGGFLIGLATGLFVGTVLEHRDLDDWQQASPWLTLLIALVAAVGVSALSARLADRLPGLGADRTDGVRPVMDLGPDQVAVWRGSIHSKILMAVGVVSTLGLAISAYIAGSSWWVLIIPLLIGVAVLSLSAISVRADRTGLEVRYGVLPWPKQTIGIDRIESASAIDVKPIEWGGWGYRGSLKLMKQAAVVLRAGPGIKLDLAGGKVFVVTVDDPETPVALLNAEINRHAALTNQ